MERKIVTTWEVHSKIGLCTKLGIPTSQLDAIMTAQAYAQETPGVLYWVKVINTEIVGGALGFHKPDGTTGSVRFEGEDTRDMIEPIPAVAA